jgi:hypothetical protein
MVEPVVAARLVGPVAGLLRRAVAAPSGARLVEKPVGTGLRNPLGRGRRVLEAQHLQKLVAALNRQD